MHSLTTPKAYLIKKLLPLGAIFSTIFQFSVAPVYWRNTSYFLPPTSYLLFSLYSEKSPPSPVVCNDGKGRFFMGIQFAIISIRTPFVSD